MIPMWKHAIYVAMAAILAAAVFFSMKEAHALNQVVRPYQSVRSAGMGGVILTTGLYDENFYNNPARVTANPKWKVQLPDPMIETTFDTTSALGDLLGSNLSLNDISPHVGDNLHGRVQLVFPAVYLPIGKNGYAIGLIASSQFDIDAREAYRIDPYSFTDIGPAFTYGRKFLENDALSVGATAHLTYRIAGNQAFSFIDVIQDEFTNLADLGGDGAHIDFDVGATYDLPWAIDEWKFSSALSLNNLLGGTYENIPIRFLDNGSRPPSQPFVMGFGFSARNKQIWEFTDFVGALEFRDIGNLNGSFFKSVHVGAEAHYHILAVRLGLNQGYPGIGIGLDLTALQFDVAFYGEEMSPNVGGMQDRRLAIRLGFQI